MRREELADAVSGSIHGVLMALPDETRVFPAHGAGSACGYGAWNEVVR